MTVGSGVVSGVGTDVATVYHQLTQINRALRTRGGQGSLSAGVAAALWTIANHSPIRLSTLAQRESVTAPTMSRIVATLEEQGYVERMIDPDDARARLFTATPAGIELLSHARSLRAQLLADAIDRLDADDRDAVHRGLAALAGALDVCDRPRPDS
ncbi:MarR family transcriptional regulator [Gordonia bronchialis]|nr:MarR family transcriptional regulator [Gordonia bronchialis]